MLLTLLTSLTLLVGDCRDVWPEITAENLARMTCYVVVELGETSPEYIVELLAPYLTAEPEYTYMSEETFSVTLQLEVEGVAYHVFYVPAYYGLLQVTRLDE